MSQHIPWNTEKVNWLFRKFSSFIKHTDSPSSSKKCSIQTLPPLHWISQVKGNIIKTYSILPSHLQLGLLSDISHNYRQHHTNISWSITVVPWIWKYENYCDTLYGIVSLTSVTFFLFSSCSSSVDFLSWSRRRFASSRSLSLSRSTW